MTNRITPDTITKLEPGQVFVFGSNLSELFLYIIKNNSNHEKYSN